MKCFVCVFLYVKLKWLNEKQNQLCHERLWKLYWNEWNFRTLVQNTLQTAVCVAPFFCILALSLHYLTRTKFLSNIFIALSHQRLWFRFNFFFLLCSINKHARVLIVLDSILAKWIKSGVVWRLISFMCFVWKSMIPFMNMTREKKKSLSNSCCLL